MDNSIIGFSDFDNKTSGLQPSDLIIIAARPSMGKTSLALDIARYASLHANIATAMFSLEMSKEQLGMRMLCAEARVNSSKLRTGYLASSDWPRLSQAGEKLANAKIFIDDSGALSLLDVRARARRLAAEEPLGLVIIDYLQLMQSRGKTESRQLEVSEISRGLKSLAKEINVPVVALSQLSRAVESRTDKRPMLSDLRESGSIEQDADVVAFIYRDEVYNPDTPDAGVAEILIRKQRNGPIGDIRLQFENQYTRFYNLASAEEVPREEEEPYCLDMATSIVPWNRVLLNRNSDTPLEPGIAADEYGNPTTDPHKAAAVMPTGSYKGYGLSSMVDVLCGVYTGMAFGRSIPAMFTTQMTEQRKLGQFYMVMRVDACQSQSDFESRLQQMRDEVSSEPSKTGERVQLANDPQIEEEQRRQKKGIPVDDSLLNEFHKLSSELNVEMVL